MKILAIDIGGTNIKFLAGGEKERRKVPSGREITPAEMAQAVLAAADGWEFDAVSLGYPGQVEDGRIVTEPKNLGKGWVGFDFAEAFGRPAKVINDAAMQALGSYQGEEMLFLGLGTGLGSALVLRGMLQPLEVAHLPYRKGRTYEDFLGNRGLKRLGKRKWRKKVHEIVGALRVAFQVDYVVLGGGNARLLKKLPKHARLGSNSLAFEGGFRLWEDDPIGSRRKIRT